MQFKLERKQLEDGETETSELVNVAGCDFGGAASFASSFRCVGEIGAG